MSAGDAPRLVGRVDLDGCYLTVHAASSGHRAVRVRAGAFWSDLDLDAAQAAELVRLLTMEAEP